MNSKTSQANTSTSDDAMIDWIEHTGVTILDFERRSHEDSKFKSFKVTLSSADYMYLYKPSLWPKGVRIEKFRHIPKSRTNNYGSLWVIHYGSAKFRR